MFGFKGVLEVPLKDKTGYVGLCHVGGNRFVLETRDDYNYLYEQLSAWKEQNNYESDAQYKSFVERSMITQTGQQQHGHSRWGAYGNCLPHNMTVHMDYYGTGTCNGRYNEIEDGTLFATKGILFFYLIKNRVKRQSSSISIQS